MPRLRLGVALLVPPPISIEIDGLRRACGDGALGRIPAHLTLVPPVNVSREDLPVALALVRSAAAAVAGPISVGLGPVTTFHPANPVVYLAVDTAGDGRDALAEVGRIRDAVFRPPLDRPLTWPFVPHVTLADDMDPARIPSAIAAMADYRTTVVLAAVTLLQEQPPGRVWHPIADARLGRPAVVARGGLPVELWWSTIADPEVAPVLAPTPAPPAPSAPPAPAALLARATPAERAGAAPFVLSARRAGLVLGAAWGWRRGAELEIVDLVVTDAAGTEDIERHLRAAVAAEAAEATNVAAAD